MFNKTNGDTYHLTGSTDAQCPWHVASQQILYPTNKVFALSTDGWTPAALINGSLRFIGKLQHYTVAVLVNIYVLA